MGADITNYGIYHMGFMGTAIFCIVPLEGLYGPNTAIANRYNHHDKYCYIIDCRHT
jgi:hypothetical protein